MNSDASDARKERSGRGERRYLRLGRESSVQLPGDESWLDELEDYEAEGVELDDEEVRRLVGTVLEDWDEDADADADADSIHDRTVLDLDTTPRAAQALGGARGVPEDAIAGADASESSIWDESDAFWSSSTPPAVSAPESKKAASATTPKSSSSSQPNKKRMFEVARDDAHPPQESPVLGSARSGKKDRDSYEVRSERKRSVLGDGTPNVNAKMPVATPLATMTPGSYYDEQGFLRT